MTSAPVLAPPTTVPLATDWRCPRCDRLCSRLSVARLAPGEWIEVKCRCNAYSTAEGGAGGVVVRAGRHERGGG